MYAKIRKQRQYELIWFDLDIKEGKEPILKKKIITTSDLNVGLITSILEIKEENK